MISVIVEATNGRNWGKFVVAKFDAAEWERRSETDGRPLLRSRGWGPDHIWVLDIETCEGAAFSPGGFAAADLDKHRVWVCPLFEPFLQWLYGQELHDLTTLPQMVTLAEDQPTQLAGFRRHGPRMGKKVVGP